MSKAARRQQGFTLIEVLAAFFMTTVILVFVAGIFRENGRQRSAASELLRVETTATAALELLAQDLEGALFVARPPTRDPRDHPWVFIADRNTDLGATQLRFTTQNVPRSNLGENASTWVEVAYFLVEDEFENDQETDGPSFTLWRWRSNRPPSVSNQRFPDADDLGSARIAEGIANFGVTFLDADGGSVDEWDSTLSVGASPMPIAAEIRLVLYRDARSGESDQSTLQIPGKTYERHVSLPMHRPIDLAALLEAAAGESGDASCSTVDACVALDDVWFSEQLENECDGDEELCDLLAASSVTCWSEIASGWPGLAATAAVECEDLP